MSMQKQVHDGTLYGGLTIIAKLLRRLTKGLCSQSGATIHCWGLSDASMGKVGVPEAVIRMIALNTC